MNTPATQPKRAVIYTRVGHARHLDDGRSSRAIAQQTQLCAAFVRENSLQLAHVYSDVGERVEWNDLVDAVTHDRVDTLVVASLDRICRSVLDFARIVRMLDEHDCTLVSVSESIDTSTPLGRAMVSFAGAFAEIESGVAR